MTRAAAAQERGGKGPTEVVPGKRKLKERTMSSPRKLGLALYVERSLQRWVVRDPDGNFWIVPPGEQPWDQRLPYQPTDGAELEPVPGHYISMLGLPA